MAKGAIIVGAGPVGLMLAGELRLGGVDVAVYEKLPAPSGESRGLGFTRRTAEVLDQRGLLERLGDFRWGTQGHFGGVRIDFDKLEENHYGVSGLDQSHTEAMLETWVREIGVELHRGHEVVDLRQDADGVVVTFDGTAGRGEERAEYLIGCDGARSVVRKLAGVDFPGWAATRGMYMADVVGGNVRPRPIGERVPGGGMVLAVRMESGADRIVIHENGVRPVHAKENITFAEVADAWQRTTGESIHHASARWVSAFTNTTRLAAEYRHGRVLLCGDSAHIHMPAGAQGLSVGLQDAVNLGWKLAATINGWAPAGLLDTYHAERHPVGERLLRNTRAQTLLYLTGDEMEPLRSVMAELMTIPDAARHMAGMVSGLEVRYDMGASGHPLLGLRLAPDRELEVADGRRVRVADLLRPARGVLIATDEASAVTELAAGWSDRVDVVAGRWAAGEAARRPALPAAALVRPDGHIAWAAPHGGDLVEALRRWFGSSRPTPHTAQAAGAAAGASPGGA